MAESLKPGAPGPEGCEPCLKSVGGPILAPASSAQTRIWWVELLHPGMPSHHLPLVLEMAGELDRPALEASLQDLADRHEAFRTEFVFAEDVLRQRILPRVALAMEFVDLAEGAEPEQRRRREALIEAQVHRAFEVTRAPLVRTKLLRLAPDRHVLLLVLHHLVADGWSLGILHRELPALYVARRSGRPARLPAPGITYREYAVRQQACPPDFGAIETWRRRLAGAPAHSGLRSEHLRDAEPRSIGKPLEAEVPATAWTAFTERCRRERASPLMGLLAVLAVLLHRLSGQEDLVIGIPSAGRERPGLEGVVGVFLNLLPLRCRVDGRTTLRDLLKQLREVALEAYSNQAVPFEQLVEALHPERSAGHTPLFQTVLNLLPPAFDSPAPWPDLNVRGSVPQGGQSFFDLNLYAARNGDQLRLLLSYNASRHRPERLEEFLRQFVLLVDELGSRPDTPIGVPSLVTHTARNLLPDPTRPLEHSLDPGVRAGIGSGTGATPDFPAISQGRRIWTRAQLDQAVDHLVSELGRTLRPLRTVVAVGGPRSFGLIAAMRAVLGSGQILLMLDPHLPVARRQLMLEEARAGLLIRVEAGHDPLTDGLGDALRRWTIDADSGGRIDERNATPGTLHVAEAEADADAAYLFFTSGTTGRPRAVLGSRQGLEHFLRWQRDEFEIGSRDRAAQLTGFSFDVVQRDVLTPLTAGATLCLPVPGVDDAPDRILDWLAAERITLVHAVPSLAQAWLEAADPNVRLPDLRLAFFAGEPLTDTLVRRWRQFAPNCRILNLYGPTETTLAKCCYEVPANPGPGIMPIGRPLPQTQILVPNEARQLCGIGEPGELVIRTPFRSHGYFHAPEETARRFLPNPWSQDPNDLVYGSGDLGCYRSDGSLEILGRRDDQVKIRGVRIEPEEIAYVIATHPGVRANVVVARANAGGEKRLIAYVVPAGACQHLARDLRDHLRRVLPAACLPSAVVTLDELPLTPNGKIDRARLPAPPIPGPESDAEATLHPPGTEQERQLVRIWSEVLGCGPIGIESDFFELGGHSLLALSLLGRMRRELNLSLDLPGFFRAPTIRGLLATISGPRHSPDRVQARSRRLRGARHGVPLFVVPGYFGLSGLRPSLAAAIREICPYDDRLRYAGVDDDLSPRTSMTGIAEHVIGQIRELHPVGAGPLCLAGFSYGGTVAFEIACRLRQAGQDIAALLLYDSRFARGFRVRNRLEFAREILRRSLGQPPGRRGAFLARLIRAKWDSWGPRIRFPRSRVAPAEPLPMPGDVNPEMATTGLLKENVRLASFAAFESYQPGVYEGRVVLFKAAETTPNEWLRCELPPCNGWGPYVAGPFEVVSVPRDHLGVFTEPIHPVVIERTVQILTAIRDAGDARR